MGAALRVPPGSACWMQSLLEKATEPCLARLYIHQTPPGDTELHEIHEA